MIRFVSRLLTHGSIHPTILFEVNNKRHSTKNAVGVFIDIKKAFGNNQASIPWMVMTLWLLIKTSIEKMNVILIPEPQCCAQARRSLYAECVGHQVPGGGAAKN